MRSHFLQVCSLLLCDVTLRSPLHGNGEACPAASRINGAVLSLAESQKAKKYKEAVDSDLVHFVTLGFETGGRWNDAALDLIEMLAHHRARDVPQLLRKSVQLAWKDRWCSMVGMAVQDAIAASILAPHGPKLVLDQSAAPSPESDVLLDGQWWAFDQCLCRQQLMCCWKVILIT